MSKTVLMKGNEALAEAAIIAGCRHYFAYPITPRMKSRPTWRTACPK
jgi:2-oxoglutarate ferredoxin oxidoreductase subunit alpha